MYLGGVGAGRTVSDTAAGEPRRRDEHAFANHGWLDYAGRHANRYSVYVPATAVWNFHTASDQRCRIGERGAGKNIRGWIKSRTYNRRRPRIIEERHKLGHDLNLEAAERACTIVSLWRILRSGSSSGRSI